MVHSARIQDRVGARALLIRLFALFATIGTVFADSGYTGSLIEWTKLMFGWTLTVVKRTEAHKFVVLPKRWIVERTIAWLARCRRLAKDWECLNCTGRIFLRWASIRLMLRKLCQTAK